MARLDRQVVRWMKRLEKGLVRLVVLGVIALVVVQLALARATDPLEFYLTLSQKIETTPISSSEVDWQPNLVFSVQGGDGSKLIILVNDQSAGNLANGKLELVVQPGDKLSVDARQASGDLKLKVSGVGQQLTYPKLNQTWPLRGSILELGEVK